MSSTLIEMIKKRLTMKSTTTVRYIGAFIAAIISFSSFSHHAAADGLMPGNGIVIQPGQENIDGENFQTIIIIKALEERIELLKKNHKLEIKNYYIKK